MNNEIKKDDQIINHIRNVKLLQAIHSGKKFYVECYPTDEGAIIKHNSNWAVKEIELPNFNLYEEKLGYRWVKETTPKEPLVSGSLPVLNKEKLLVWLNGLKDSQYSEHNAKNTKDIKDWYEILISDIERLWQ